MVDRPNWGPGGEHRGLVPFKPDNEGGSDVGFPDTPVIVRGRDPGTLPSSAPPPPLHDQEVTHTDGLPPEVVRELTNAPGGLEANTAVLRETVDIFLDSDPEVGDRAQFISRFNKLSDGVRAKAMLALWRRPHLSLKKLLDRVENEFTLAQQAEAEKFMRELGGR